MRALRHRLELLAGQMPKASQPPASRRWFVALHLLRRFLDPWIPEQERERAARNIDSSIALLDEHFGKSGAPRPDLEYFCQACVLRLSYTTPDWEGREWAVMDANYEDRLQQIERARLVVISESGNSP